MILSVLRISGHSMLPTLTPGNRIVASSIPYLFSSPKVGDIVVFKKNKELIIKRISKVEKHKYFVKGDNKKDSLEYLPLTRNQILAKCIIH